MINEKEQMLAAIYAEYPTLEYDGLKKYYIEQMVESYIANPKKFKELTYQAKNEKHEHNKLPTEIYCISKIDNDDKREAIDALHQEQ